MLPTLVLPPSFHYDWETSSSSMNDPMIDSGKASDISVSSWPMEPIQWTPFPLLHQLSRQRPVSRTPALLWQPRPPTRDVHILTGRVPVCCGAEGKLSGAGRLFAPQTLAFGHGGRGVGVSTTRPSLTGDPVFPTAQSPAAPLLLRGHGAGQSGKELDGLDGSRRTTGNSVQLLKPTTFYFHITSSVKESQTLGQYNQCRYDVSFTQCRSPEDYQLNFST